MSHAIHESKFDVVLVAGPRASTWPSAGARALALVCREPGLPGGWGGGDDLQARGVLPLQGTGGLVVAEDIQRRIHRFRARAVVRWAAHAEMPDPFSGSHGEGLVPLATAHRILAETRVSWGPATAILGSGNGALRFGAKLLEQGVPEVYCIESFANWGAKRFAGWEVERRRFEVLGGKLIEAQPVSLSPKAAQLWEFRVSDSKGTRLLEVTRVVSAGPFRQGGGFREHPPGSLLFESELTRDKPLDVERARALGVRIARALVEDLGEQREECEKILRRAKARIRRYTRHREESFSPTYQGKWLSSADGRRLRSFAGVPKIEHRKRWIASIECLESISCSKCQDACPEGAIAFKGGRAEVLDESKCTGCGLCLPACPSLATLMIREQEDKSLSQLTLPWKGEPRVREMRPWAASEFATLLNRRGESLGTGRVIAATAPAAHPVQQVQVEVPSHLLWEVRGIRRPRANSAEDSAFLAAQTVAETPKVEITFNGERRRVSDKIPVSAALFEIGKNRPTDALYCKDGSCGLCQVSVDGVNKLACQTPTHRGMAIKTEPEQEGSWLCPCARTTPEAVVDRIRQAKLRSPEAVLSAVSVGDGKCHGQLCIEPFRRVLEREGIDASQWIDWRFPSVEWVL